MNIAIRKWTRAAWMLCLLPFAAEAALVGVNLGTAAPPATVGTFAMTPFSTAAQAAIADLSSVTSIPGGPNGTTIGVSPAIQKRTVPTNWATWSHGYTGPVFFNTVNGGTSNLLLPAGVVALYLYAEPNANGPTNITVTPIGGAPLTVSVNGSSGATGYGFYTTAGETIASVTVAGTVGDGGWAIGEFGVARVAQTTGIPTLSPLMIAALALMLLLGAATMIRRRG